MRITYLKHHQIDKKRWDAAIENADNGLVYALSWFLDIASPNWEALCAGGYNIVMPLTWRSKFGLKYLYQPIFIQQLGVFSEKGINEQVVDDFIKEANRKFRFINIQLNHANSIINSKGFILRNTQLIDISKSYEELYSNYKKNHRKNLEKVNNSGLIINSGGSSSDFIELTSEMFTKKGVDEIKPKDIAYLKKVVDHSLKLGLGEFYFGYLNEEICAGAFFLKWKKRVVVYTAMSNLGRQAGAMFGLIDKYLKENAGKDLLFDFAGSNIPGVKYRNLGFGARNEIYYRVTINNLPIPFKWFKK